MAQASKDRREKASKKLMLACLTIVVCLALLIGGTYALFTSEHKVTNHLSAGNLTAELVRDKLVCVTLNENGHLQTYTDEANKTFTNPTDEKLFGNHENDKIAPGSSFTADMLLTNNGSVAFKYWIEIKLDSGKTNMEALTQQLRVTVTPDGGTATTKMLSEGLEVGNGSESGIAIVDKGQGGKFKVTLEFVNDPNNNAAQGGEVHFDFIVHATQYAEVSNG